jgi:trans-aconitate 2-methyltransferase
VVEPTWDPGQYSRFDAHRARPFDDLMSRVTALDPGLVVDLGCGDGPLTLTLQRRWPGARVVGLDASSEMLAAARGHDSDGAVEWVQADLRVWDPAALGAHADVVVTNATLQWVPDHLDLIVRIVGALTPGGWFAMQVPDNLDAPSHALMREVADAHPRAADLRAAVDRLSVESPQTYLELLAGLGCEVDVWTTTYLHVLDPDDETEHPVLEWVRGTGLRPVLTALAGDPGGLEAFLADYRERLAAAYPRTLAGVVMPFRRTFAVARAAGAAGAARAARAARAVADR